MKNETSGSKLLIWILYFISTGMLVTGGIYIEKIILMNASIADILKAWLFCLVGAAISGYSFFASKAKK